MDRQDQHYQPQPYTLQLPQLLNEIETGKTKVPQFQREFVWSKERSARLLDSILKNYPIGTFIFWKTKEELRYVRNIGSLSLPATPKGDFVNYVLDGQQRITSLFTILKGLVIVREEMEDDYSEFYVDLEASADEQIVVPGGYDTGDHVTIKLSDLLDGDITIVSEYPKKHHRKIQNYRDTIKSYPFSAVQVPEAPISVATEIFTRLNIGGKALDTFEIMVAKTFDLDRGFDLAEKYDNLMTRLTDVNYGTIPHATVLQTISIFIMKECRKKDILGLSKTDVIDIWPKVADAIEHAVDYFRQQYRIPVSRLLPYPALIVPFAYYFHLKGRRPTGKAQEYLTDYFFRASLGGRYSQSVESRLAQDIRKIDLIAEGKLPSYEWAIDTSAEFLERNGLFSVGRAYIKALLCILAYQQPKSFDDNSDVNISNDWLKQANSKNYHHFFPKGYLNKQKRFADEKINHIANITIVDDFLNKSEIRNQAPSKYMKKFQRVNPRLKSCMKTHLIDLHSSGIWEDDYEKFFKKRCRAFSKELQTRIIEQEVDHEVTPTAAGDTILTEEQVEEPLE